MFNLFKCTLNLPASLDSHCTLCCIFLEAVSSVDPCVEKPLLAISKKKKNCVKMRVWMEFIFEEHLL